MNAQERRVYFALALGFSALLVASVTAFFAVNGLVAESELVDHSHQIRRQLVLLLSTQQDVQLGQRGYVLTGKTNYLQPYEQSRGRSESVIRDLATLVRDHPAQTERLAQLEELVTRQNSHAEQIVNTRRLEGLDAAQRIVDSGEGKRMMDALRMTIADMDDEEQRLLAVRYAQERKAVTRLNWTLFSSTGFALLVVAFGGALIHRDFGRRKQHDLAILEQNQRLESRVQERTRELQASIEELSRFNHSMVDRELRMIELKQEINELCSSLNLPPRYRSVSVTEDA